MERRSPKRILITGGAGFVGASLGVALAGRHPDREVVALDSLKRRGSELNLPRLREAGVRFVHGDVRAPSDLAGLEPIDALVECSAEPSAFAGRAGDTDFVVGTNLLGAYHCLELARRNDAQVVFLSTSRVYPVHLLNQLAYEEAETRFELFDEQPLPGVSRAGISERFPLDGPRTLYGTTKLAAEMLLTEYADSFGLSSVVDRCGVIAGPWQMGKVDQGVFSHWLLSHHLGRDLCYIGYGGAGKQVRDLVHIDDVVDLIDEQLECPDQWAGVTVNVGGGRESSLSLVETTDLCRELTGNAVAIGSHPQTRPGDIPIYVSDCEALHRHSDWRPRRGPRQILEETLVWIRDNDCAVRAALT